MACQVCYTLHMVAELLLCSTIVVDSSMPGCYALHVTPETLLCSAAMTDSSPVSSALARYII